MTLPHPKEPCPWCDMCDKWKIKYQSCRAAFLAMSREYTREKKEQAKDRQRISQLAREIAAIGTCDTAIYQRAVKIWRIVR